MPEWLQESFQQPVFDRRLRWFCEPPAWRVLEEPPCLELATSASTDFWQRTHYGFRADNGHFLHTSMEGDFVMTTDVEFQGLHQYDQAGLMVRRSADCWLKASVEFEPEEANRLGAVVTRQGYSDWSTQEVDNSVARIALRITRSGGTFLVEAALPGAAWTQIRLAHLDGAGPVLAGLYACSPKQAGFRPRFYHLRVETR